MNTFLVLKELLSDVPAFIADFRLSNIISALAVTPTWVRKYQAGSFFCATFVESFSFLAKFVPFYS